MNVVDFENIFFDRKKILGLLDKRVTDLKDGYRQNLALLGNRYIGKTAILHKFLGALDEEDVVAIYLNLENNDFPYIFYKFSTSLLYNYSRIKKLPLFQDLHVLLDSTRKFIPHTVEMIEAIESLVKKGKTPDAYKKLINLPEKFTAETNQFCILILDEFQNLEELSIPNIFQDLGKTIMMQKKCLYIVASSSLKSAENILAEKLSLLFGNFEILSVEPFDLKTSQEFIVTILGELKVSESLRDFLINLTGGHPLSLNLILKEIVCLSSLHKQHEVFMPLMVQALENTIFNQWGVIGRHFELFMNNLCAGKGNRSMGPVLISLSEGHQKLRELVDDAGINQNLMKQKLNRLMEAGAVVKNSDFYYFNDRLFQYWIKYVYKKYFKAVNQSSL